MTDSCSGRWGIFIEMIWGLKADVWSYSSWTPNYCRTELARNCWVKKCITGSPAAKCRWICFQGRNGFPLLWREILWGFMWVYGRECFGLLNCLHLGEINAYYCHAFNSNLLWCRRIDVDCSLPRALLQLCLDGCGCQTLMACVR